MKWWFGAFLAVLIYSIAAFVTTSDNTFQNVDEDINMIRRGVLMIGQPSTLLNPDDSGRNQIVTYLLLGAMHHFFSYTPAYYYFLILLLHLGSTFLLMALARRLGLGSRGAVMAGIFFLVLSIHFQNVAWITSTGRLLLNFFSLTAFLLFDDFRRTGQVKKAVASWLVWLLALLCAEEAFILPALFFIYDALILRKNLFLKKNWREARIYIPLFLTSLFILAVQYFLYSSQWDYYIYPRTQSGLLQKIQGVVWSVLNLWIPRREALEAFVEPTGVIRTAIPALVFTPFLILVFYHLPTLLKRKTFLLFSAFCFFWFILAFLPFSFRTVGENWREYPQPRYLYWPLMGLSFFVGMVVEALLDGIGQMRRGKLRLAACSGIMVAGLYFYALNVWTYCFMADKLCQIACRKEPVIEEEISSKPVTLPLRIRGLS